MKKPYIWACGGIMLGSAVMAAVATQRGEKSEGGPRQVALAQLPIKARTALTKLAGENKLLGVIAENDGGAVTYKGVWRVAGKAHSVVLTVEGALVSTEEVVEGDEVPPAVRRAADKRLPGAQNLIFQRLTRVTYEVFGTVSGKKKTVEVSPTGTFAEHEGREGKERHENQERRERD
jgi:hypothetical protein